MTIPQMVEEVRVGRMPHRHLIVVLTASGISTAGVGAIVAATTQHQNSKVTPHVQQHRRFFVLKDDFKFILNCFNAVNSIHWY
jgi:hypothetical protein